MQTPYTPLEPINLTDQEIHFYQTEGYLLLPGLLNPETVSSLRDEVMEIMKSMGMKHSKLIQTTQYLEQSALDRLINASELKVLAKKLMGGDATLYMPFTAVKSGNGGGVFHFHQDNQYTEFDGPGINFWFALTPMNPENGCLQVVPRSHTQGTFEPAASGDGDQHKRVDWDPIHFLPVRMHAGDCIAFSRLTIHGSGPNLSPEPRVAYAIQFHRDDVRARWEHQDWMLLKDNPRWPTRPVDHISAPTHTRLDGH